MSEMVSDAVPGESTIRSTAGPTAGSPGESAGSGSAGDVGVEELMAIRDRLGGLPTATGDAARIDRIGLMEDIRGILAATQARESVEFAASQVAGQVAAGVPASRRGRGVPEQIGYARRLPPATAAHELAVAGAWIGELPAVYGLLRAGRISEWVAKLVVKETRGLSVETRRQIAAELADDLPQMSPREAEAAARRLAYEADPAAVLARARTARSDRRVGIRPAPDTMAVLSAFLPAEQGVAAWACLDRHARAQRAAGDPRTRDQIMADTLVERVTGQATAGAVPVEIGLTMTADDLRTTTDDLLNHHQTHPDPDHEYGPTDGPTDDHTGTRTGTGTDAGTGAFGGVGGGLAPAYLDGYGPFPAELALDLMANADGPAGDGALDGVAVWVRRLFTDPVDDSIVHIDTKRRRFDGALARLLRYRDRVCRDPFCSATIRHLDHVKPYRDGGPTSAANGAGLCERGNYVKDMPGWSTRVTPPTDQPDASPSTGDADATGDSGGAQRVTHCIEVRTPTGHRYTSTPPPALGPGGNYRRRDLRAARRRFEFLQRERLIAGLPSATDLRPHSPPRRN